MSERDLQRWAAVPPTPADVYSPSPPIGCHSVTFYTELTISCDLTFGDRSKLLREGVVRQPLAASTYSSSSGSNSSGTPSNRSSSSSSRGSADRWRGRKALARQGGITSIRGPCRERTRVQVVQVVVERPGGEDVLDIMHGLSRMTIDPCIPTMPPGRTTSGFHRPGRPGGGGGGPLCKRFQYKEHLRCEVVNSIEIHVWNLRVMLRHLDASSTDHLQITH